MLITVFLAALYLFIGVGTALSRQDKETDAFKVPGSFGMWVALWLPMITFMAISRVYKLILKGA